MNLLKKISLFFILFLPFKFAYSEESYLQTDRPYGFALGTEVTSYANNFGVGLTLDFPRMFNDQIFFKLNADMAWVQGIRKKSSTTTWMPYGMLKFGLYGGDFISHTFFRLYGGGGLVLLFPWDNLSSSSVEFGAFGTTGVEVFIDPLKSWAMFAELGGMGSSGNGNRLVGNPIYANGFTIAWGYKYYF